MAALSYGGPFPHFPGVAISSQFFVVRHFQVLQIQRPRLLADFKVVNRGELALFRSPGPIADFFPGSSSIEP